MPKYIERDSLLKKAKSLQNKLFAVPLILDAIEYAPTVDVVEVMHGKWIRHIDDIFPADSTLECSVCHEEECIFLCGDNYCPNCGAKMDLKVGEEE